MEKRIYNKPETEVFNMESVESILAVSIPKGEGTPPGIAEAPKMVFFNEDDDEFFDDDEFYDEDDV